LLAAGLGYKLLAAPLLVALLYFGLFGLRGPIANVTVFEAGMAPQIGGAIVAIQYGLDADLITRWWAPAPSCPSAPRQSCGIFSTEKLRNSRHLSCV
jgi:hypothetical protein